jgi:Arc/MetJ family transcription regulator
MRTNIEIDDELLAQAFSVSRSRTKKELINEALKDVNTREKSRPISPVKK